MLPEARGSFPSEKLMAIWPGLFLILRKGLKSRHGKYACAKKNMEEKSLQMATKKVLDLKAFVPAKDFALSRRFYLDLGFHENWGNDQACELELDGYRFILQNFYVKEHADNFMMSLIVEDADEWWDHINRIGLLEKYDLYMAKPPALQPWGLRVLYLTDPTGVLWHIADRKEL